MQGSLDLISPYAHPRVLAMLFLGFSAGLPLLLIFSTLSIWLSEAGVERSAVTYLVGQRLVIRSSSFGRCSLINYLSHFWNSFWVSDEAGYCYHS